jgi:hypothetical protein
MGRQALVRLDDGTMWLPPSPDVEREWHMEILGITCTEIFTHVRIRPTDNPLDGYITIGRLPLSSLGEGIPPD